MPLTNVHLTPLSIAPALTAREPQTRMAQVVYEYYLAGPALTEASCLFRLQSMGTSLLRRVRRNGSAIIVTARDGMTGPLLCHGPDEVRQATLA